MQSARGWGADTFFSRAGVPPAMTKTVTPQREYGSKDGMGVFGWLIAVGVALVLFPLLPLVALVVVVSRLVRGKSVRPS